MAFSDSYYKDIEMHLRNTVYGGYVGLIIGGGNPRVFETYDYFKTDATNNTTLRQAINRYTSIVLADVTDVNIRAEQPENDLLKALHEARRQLSFFERMARGEGKTIKNKQIIILDTGIVTTGDMNFLTLGINRVEFSKLSDDEREAYASRVADSLYNARVLPDLSGVDIVFIGLGDVAMPQEELSSPVEKGIKNIWRAVFEKSNVNVNNVDFEESPRGNVANLFKEDGSGFPFVMPITFEQPTIIIEEPVTISDGQVSFIVNRADYLNPEDAEIILSNYAVLLNSYLSQNPDVIVYVVGSMARANLERDYSTALSERRAITVMETLIKFGVPEEKMVVFGLGEFFPNRYDEFPRGVFVEEIARNNRKVVLIPSNLTDYVREVLAVRDQLSRRR
jgi:outer membrane protein OmpA-like peptidoglycan-associated protein